MSHNPQQDSNDQHLQEDFKRLHEFYNDALDTYGPHDARSVHWSDSENQITRFETLIKVGDISESTVLDVGCGLGDLYKFLLKKQILVDYTGLDIMPEFIQTAQEKYPEAHFLCKNIFDLDEKFHHYDYVLASGSLTFKMNHNNQDFYFDMIKKMYSLAKKALAFNMLNKKYHIDDTTYAAYVPEEVVNFCKTFCSNVKLVTGYLPQDFTVYLYKENKTI